MSRFFKSFFSLLLFTLTIYSAYTNLKPVVLTRLGLTPQEIKISGTGSMYPTFPKGAGRDPKELARQIVGSPGMLPYPNGLTLFGRSFFSHHLARGDIVVFYNVKTAEISQKLHGTPTGFVKRLIGLPGETLEIRDGLVLVNGSPLTEPYIAHSRSTFGGQTLPDCLPLTIPPNHYFVMGDNRTASGDSRHELGLIDESDIDHVLPLTVQRGTYDAHWRDASGDLSESAKIHLDKSLYLQLLNSERLKAKLKPLAYNSKLEKSASLRGAKMLATADFSFAATRSGYPMPRALAAVGYNNIVWGETWTLGYAEATDLFDSDMDQPKQKQFLLDPQFQDIGISEVSGLLNSCPAQIIISHLGGYVPPNYQSHVVDSWAQALSQLQRIQPSWAAIDPRVSAIISLRITRIAAIVSRMQKNQWLTDQEKSWAKEDEALAKQQFDLTTHLAR